MREPPGPCGAGRLRVACDPTGVPGAGGPGRPRGYATSLCSAPRLEARPCPPVPPAPSTQVEPGVLMIASACLLEAQPGPAAAWLVLLGWAAVCAGGRRPAREIATREPLAWLVVASLVFRAPSGPPGPAARPCNADRHRGGLQSVGARCPCVASPGPPVPPAPSTPAAPAVLCEVVRRLVVRPGPPGPAARPCNADRHRGGLPSGVAWCAGMVHCSVMSHAIPLRRCAGLYQSVVLRHSCL